MDSDLLCIDISLYYNYLFYFPYPLLDYQLCDCRDNVIYSQLLNESPSLSCITGNAQ